MWRPSPQENLYHNNNREHNVYPDEDPEKNAASLFPYVVLILVHFHVRLPQVVGCNLLTCQIACRSSRNDDDASGGDGRLKERRGGLGVDQKRRESGRVANENNAPVVYRLEAVQVHYRGRLFSLNGEVSVPLFLLWRAYEEVVLKRIEDKFRGPRTGLGKRHESWMHQQQEKSYQ